MSAVFVFLMGMFVGGLLAVIMMSVFMLSSHMSQDEGGGEGDG